MNVRRRPMTHKPSCRPIAYNDNLEMMCDRPTYERN